MGKRKPEWHLAIGVFTACGRVIYGQQVTTEARKTTCGTCRGTEAYRRTWHAQRPKPKRKGPTHEQDERI